MMAAVLALPLQEEPAPVPAPTQEPPKLPVPPEVPAGSEAAGDRVKQLLEQFRGVPKTPAAPTSASGLEALLTGGAAPAVTEPANTVIHLQRMSDPVQLRREGRTQDLQFWDNDRELRQGDEVLLGGQAIAVVDFPDGTNLRMFGPMSLQIASAPDAPTRYLVIPRLEKTCLVQLFERPMVLALPGGNEIYGAGTALSLTVIDQRTLDVRNPGPGPVTIRSPIFGREGLVLEAAHRVLLPILEEVAGPTGPLEEFRIEEAARSATQRAIPLQVWVPWQVRALVSEKTVELRGTGSIPGVVRVHGTLLHVGPGEVVRIKRAGLGMTRNEE